jgi:nucleoside-diphosphate-sugar epimerase
LAAGIAALGLCEASEIKGSWLRVFSTYGPSDSPHWFIPYVIQEFLAGRAPQLTKCEQLWDYLHVEDAARAVVSVAHAKTSGVFNLGSGSAYPLRTYIDNIREILKTDLMPQYGGIAYRPDQVMHLEADISRLIEHTGWRPSVSLLTGLMQTIEFERTRSKSF